MRDEGLYLEDILEAAQFVHEFIHDVTEDEFLESDLLQSAVVHKLTIIGEAAARIPETTRIRYPRINWRSIVGFRNLAVHVYYELDWGLVWTTATTQLDDLTEQVGLILDSDFPFSEDDGSSE